MKRRTAVLLLAALLVLTAGLVGGALVLGAYSQACATGSTLLAKVCIVQGDP